MVLNMGFVIWLISILGVENEDRFAKQTFVRRTKTSGIKMNEDKLKKFLKKLTEDIWFRSPDMMKLRLEGIDKIFKEVKND